MLRATLAADGLTGPPRGSQALSNFPFRPRLKRLTPTPIPVSDNPAQAKGVVLLRKTARESVCGSDNGQLCTHSRPHSTNPSPRRVRWTLPPALSVAKCESLLVRPSASAPFTRQQLTNPHYLYWFAQHPEHEPAIRLNSADRTPVPQPVATRQLRAVRR